MFDWIEPDWPAPFTVKALVTTRQGGVSYSGYGSCNLAARVGDDPNNVSLNRARVRSVLPNDPNWLVQIHGTDVANLDALGSKPEWQKVAHLEMGDRTPAGLQPPVAQADASMTRAPNTVSAVLTADCLPVLFCDVDGTVVASAHAGWRGLSLGVLEATVNAMGVGTDKILAWVGPTISQKHFEVGPEVRDAFISVDPESALGFIEAPGGKFYADLIKLARLRLGSAGVTRVYGGGLCTYADPERFFSYRREKSSGRFGSFIWLTS